MSQPFPNSQPSLGNNLPPRAQRAAHGHVPRATVRGNTSASASAATPCARKRSNGGPPAPRATAAVTPYPTRHALRDAASPHPAQPQSSPRNTPPQHTGHPRDAPPLARTASCYIAHMPPGMSSAAQRGGSCARVRDGLGGRWKRDWRRSRDCDREFRMALDRGLKAHGRNVRRVLGGLDGAREGIGGC
ncbi:hypothetical protein ANO14919_137630 [Xylariales sp. No.14919]|nr:hypothetical protein ANO14919_137630 [Xylariales sp. No.14919]